MNNSFGGAYWTMTINRFFRMHDTIGHSKTDSYASRENIL